MKRRGPYSLQSQSRVLRRAEPPPDDPLRDRVAHEARTAIERAVPDFTAVEDGSGESLALGLIHVAAELTSVAEAGMRNIYRDRAIKYFTNQIALEVQGYHQRHVNKTARSEVGAQRLGNQKYAERPEGKQFIAGAVSKDALAKLFVDYHVALRAHVQDLQKDDDPRGAPNMLIYAVVEVLTDLLADAPESYGDVLDKEILAAIPDRLTKKRARAKEPDEPATSDRQLQADPLEAVPAGDDERLQLLRSAERPEEPDHRGAEAEHPDDGVLRPAVPPEEAP
jgi:hypothetical protein